MAVRCSEWLVGNPILLWVPYCEGGGSGLSVPRPAGTEGWLPIAGLMNTKYLLLPGNVPEVDPDAMVLFITFGIMSILLKKAFCSWLCQVGTLSENLWKLVDAYSPRQSTTSCPRYGLVAEVKVLNFFRDIGQTAGNRHRSAGPSVAVTLLDSDYDAEFLAMP